MNERTWILFHTALQAQGYTGTDQELRTLYGQAAAASQWDLARSLWRSTLPNVAIERVERMVEMGHHHFKDVNIFLDLERSSSRLSFSTPKVKRPGLRMEAVVVYVHRNEIHVGVDDADRRRGRGKTWPFKRLGEEDGL